MIELKIVYNNRIRLLTVMSRYAPKIAKKEVRKPISDNFAPKRLAINFEPPTVSKNATI